MINPTVLIKELVNTNIKGSNNTSDKDNIRIYIDDVHTGVGRDALHTNASNNE